MTSPDAGGDPDAHPRTDADPHAGIDPHLDGPRGFFARRQQPPEDDPYIDPRSRWVDRFGLLLVLAALTVALLSLVDLHTGPAAVGAQVAGLVTTLTVGATLALALRASGLRARWRRWAYVVVGALIVLSLVVVLVLETPDEVTSAPPLLLLIAACAPVVVARRLVQHRVVTLATLLGAVSAYLLIALAYYYAFLTVDNVTQGHFFGTEQSTTSFMYFSLTTITTLGYGDLAAVTPLGRLLATSEAIIGQVYLVVFVALIVSLAAGRRQRALG
ncbi:ion channel [Isoptericola sp. S6320L]|uniref:potassium channel family protein n=1 Tax=Isoptericola sp. S6320L TaxID=2926411 RepID=UPI001FF56206|nr:potassium channel family protein [Isoptericola sp. S6320L]MCK0117520.1 ion channel [Isoptericola sp. S6320L]